MQLLHYSLSSCKIYYYSIRYFNNPFFPASPVFILVTKQMTLFPKHHFPIHPRSDTTTVKPMIIDKFRYFFFHERILKICLPYFIQYVSILSWVNSDFLFEIFYFITWYNHKEWTRKSKDSTLPWCRCISKYREILESLRFFREN